MCSGIAPPTAPTPPPTRRRCAFHRSLAASGPPGFHGSVAFARAALEWFDGYEDWYLVDDWAALGVLNDSAVRAPHGPVHDGVAHRSAHGAGAVYALRRGAADLGRARAATWSATAPSTGELWQRQLVLGPAPEFCALHAEPAAAALPRRALTP